MTKSIGVNIAHNYGKITTLHKTLQKYVNLAQDLLNETLSTLSKT